jgi:hypothetical protein
MDAVERVVGTLLMLLGAADLFLTVLYARIGSQVGSRIGMGLGRWIARGQWRIALLLGASLPRWRAALLSISAPLTLVWMMALWASLLTVGAALLVHPALGIQVRSPQGATPTDFAAALYVAGGSLSVVSSTDIAPQTVGYRLIFLINAFIGASAVTLTLTYFMQIYRALQTRNALGLKVMTMGGGRCNGAELVARWGPCGRFEPCYSSMAEVAGELAEVHEAHHLYPLLFYFRFDTPYPNLVLYLPTLLEASGLLHCALDEQQHGWVRRSAVVSQLQNGSQALLALLERVFLPDGFRPDVPLPSAASLAERFDKSIVVLVDAGIAIRADARARDEYVEFMQSWALRAIRLALYLGHEEDEFLGTPQTSQFAR